jgi:hypothetical protein
MLHEMLEEICFCNVQFLIFFLTLPTLWKNLLPPFSEWKIESSSFLRNICAKIFVLIKFYSLF